MFQRTLAHRMPIPGMIRDFWNMAWYVGPRGIRGTWPIGFFSLAMVSGVYLNNIRFKECDLGNYSTPECPDPWSININRDENTN